MGTRPGPQGHMPAAPKVHDQGPGTRLHEATPFPSKRRRTDRTVRHAPVRRRSVQNRTHADPPFMGGLATSARECARRPGYCLREPRRAGDGPHNQSANTLTRAPLHRARRLPMQPGKVYRNCVRLFVLGSDGEQGLHLSAPPARAAQRSAEVPSNRDPRTL